MANISTYLADALLDHVLGSRSPGSSTRPPLNRASTDTIITFPGATATWGDVVGIGLYDAATGGNLLMAVPLSERPSIVFGDTAAFAIGALVVVLT